MSEILNSTSLLIKSIEARCQEEELALYKSFAENQEGMIGDMQKAFAARHDEKIAEAKKAFSKKASHARSEIFEKQKKAVSTIYRSAADEIFEQVKLKLIDFTKADEYGLFIITSAKKIAENFGKGGVLYIRVFDKHFAPDICKELECTEIIEDESIVYGGIRVYYEKSSITVDDTLDGRLSEVCEDFLRRGRSLI